MKDYFEERYFRLKTKNIILFLFIWLMTGFALGTATLLGPVRWVSTLARNNQWGQTPEDLLVKAVIICFILFSAWLALKITRFTANTTGKMKKAGLPAIATSAAVASLLLWMNPKAINTDQSESEFATDTEARFVFGPYPTAEKIQELSERGFTAVVPLLHPAVVPFEPRLLQEEQELADAAGLEVIHIPMLPWVSDNEASLEKLKTLCGKDGKYYIHCYLGKDRVNVAKRILESTCGNSEEIDGSATSARKIIVPGRVMERGEIIQLKEKVFITPYPTDEELFNLFADGVKYIAILTDDPGKSWVTKHVARLENLGLEHKVYTGDADSRDELMHAINNSKLHPMIVHGYLVSDELVLRLAEDLNATREILKPQAYDMVIQGESVKKINPFVITGKLPLQTELQTLYNLGVRNIAASEEFAISATEKAAMKEMGFRVVQTDTDGISRILKGGGTWFIVSDGSETAAGKLITIVKQDRTING